MSRILTTVALAGAGTATAYAFCPVPGFSARVENWRARGSYKMFRNYKVFYQDEQGFGDEGTVLLINGFLQSTFDWRRVWEPLKSCNRRIIAIDMLGCGFSDKPRHLTYDLALHADLYEHILQELGIRDVHILACDMGDNVACELLARYEDRCKQYGNRGAQLSIKSICFLNGRLFVGDGTLISHEKLLLSPFIGAFICRYVYNVHIYADAIYKMYGSDNKPSFDELKEYWSIARFNQGNGVCNKFVYYAVDRINNGRRLGDAMTKTKVPRHFIAGMEDDHVRDDIVDAWKKYIPGNTITQLNDVGHYPHLERPHEVIHYYKNFRDSFMSKPAMEDKTDKAREVSSTQYSKDSLQSQASSSIGSSALGKMKTPSKL